MAIFITVLSSPHNEAYVFRSILDFKWHWFNPIISCDNLQRESHTLLSSYLKSRDSRYVSRPILAPPPLWLQKHTDLRAHEFAHDLWQQSRLANVTCAWSWRLCGINPSVPLRAFTTLQCTKADINALISSHLSQWWLRWQRDTPPLEPSFIHLSKSPVYEPPPPHTRFPSGGKGSPWREMPASGDFLNISSRVPSEGAPLEAPSTEPLQRETHQPQNPLHPGLKVPGGRTSSRFPKRGPYRKRCSSLEPFLHILQVPQQQSPLSKFPLQSSDRKSHCTSRASFNHISKSPVDEPIPGRPTEPPWKMPIPRAPFIPPVIKVPH
jgi:hypothetical protein